MADLREFTEKELMDEYCYVVAVNHNNLQGLLSCIDRKGYMSSEHGWCADVYEYGEVCIVTGDYPIGNVEAAYYTVREYEALANAIKGNNTNWDETKANLEILLSLFCKDVRCHIDNGCDWV